jgi:hypothetical protein
MSVQPKHQGAFRVDDCLSRVMEIGHQQCFILSPSFTDAMAARCLQLLQDV